MSCLASLHTFITFYKLNMYSSILIIFHLDNFFPPSKSIKSVFLQFCWAGIVLVEENCYLFPTSEALLGSRERICLTYTERDIKYVYCCEYSWFGSNFANSPDLFIHQQNCDCTNTLNTAMQRAFPIVSALGAVSVSLFRDPCCIQN